MINLILIDYLSCKRESTLEEIRNKVWKELEKHPDLGAELKSPDNYVFSSVNQEANLVEYYDYSKKLSELKLFNYFFKLVENQGNIEEKLFNSHLSKTLV
jgi:hypothetical protein